jgi:GTP cyclohydrolase I
MLAPLPDVSLTDPAPSLSPLQWVGMQGIDLPVTVAEPGYWRELHARADVQVDLPAAHVKGIHMSRLYRQLDSLAEESALSALALRHALQAMIDSHLDCQSRSARLRLSLDLLTQRPALVTQICRAGSPIPCAWTPRWRRACSSCGCRWAWAIPRPAPARRHCRASCWSRAFAGLCGRALVEPDQVASWLRRHGTLATAQPAQRGQVSVDLACDAPDLGILPLIARVEQALGTPVQTAVKRADEQAFAALNGRNLMFVEDAARRIQAAAGRRLRPAARACAPPESLHPHDAVAWA